MGFMHQDRAQESWDKIQGELRTSVPRHEVVSAPEAALAQLMKGKNGAYPDLTQKERDDFIERAQNEIKKQNAEQKLVVTEAQNKRESELTDMLFDGSLTDDIIHQSHTTGEIRDSFAIAMHKNLHSWKKLDAGKKPYEERYQSEMGLYIKMNQLADGKITAQDMRDAILKENTDGNIPDATAQKFLFTTKVGGKTIASMLTTPENWWAHPFRNAFRAIMGYPHITPESKTKALGTVTEALSNNTPAEKMPEVTKNAIKKQVVEENPHIANYDSKTGQKVYDLYGNSGRIFPDGDVKDEETEQSDKGEW